MAKSQAARPKAVKATAPTKPRAKHPSKASKVTPPSDSDDESEDTSTPAPTLLDKTFVLRLILAKVDAVKSCDWHDLAKRMGEKESDGAKPKRGKKAKKDQGKMWTGTELHDIYHNTILPALKIGRALWTDDAVAGELYLPPAPPSPTISLSPKVEVSPVEEEMVILEEIIEDEEDEAEAEVEEEGTTVELIPAELVVDEDDDKTVEDTEDAEDREELAEEGAEEITEMEVKEIDGATIDEDETAQIEVEAEKEAEGEEEREEGEEEEESQEVVVEIVKEKKKEMKAKVPVRKLTTTYRKKPASPTNITITTSPARPTLGYRQSVISKASENGKKRMRQAYSDDGDEVTVAPVRKAAKVTPPPAVPDKRRRSSRKSTS